MKLWWQGLALWEGYTGLAVVSRKCVGERKLVDCCNEMNLAYLLIKQVQSLIFLLLYDSGLQSAICCLKGERFIMLQYFDLISLSLYLSIYLSLYLD